MGRSCGSVGKAFATSSSDPTFDSNHRIGFRDCIHLQVAAIRNRWNLMMGKKRSLLPTVFIKQPRS